MPNETLDWSEKAFWTVDDPVEVSTFLTEGHTLFDGSVTWPVLALREPALASNIATMAAYVERHGMLFAPHGKTSMIPQLFRRQLDAGAWGITVATAQQAMVALRTGTPRVLIAHEVLDRSALQALLATRDELREHGSQVTVYCFVDSPEGVQLAGEAAAASLGDTFPVLLDVGFMGGRTGVRSVEAAIELARQVRKIDSLELVGAACYEGGLRESDDARGFLEFLREVTEAVLEHGLFDDGSPLVSAGGSAHFDLVASDLAGAWAQSHGVRVLLRSGAYVTHDDLDYAERTPFRHLTGEGELQPALELWAQVVSVPEDGLALVGMGKREAPFDEGLPVPKLLRRAGSTELIPISGGAVTAKLNDQHGYVHFATSDPDLAIRPGDLICFGISHPCTAFDKWRWLPLLDDDDRIIDVMRTYF